MAKAAPPSLSKVDERLSQKLRNRKIETMGTDPFFSDATKRGAS